MITHPHSITTWKDGQNILAIPEINKNIVHLKNVRDFDHGDENGTLSQRYFNHDYDINMLTSCTLYSIPFGKTGLYSHLILSFHFEDGQNLALSVEARRRPGEGFSVMKGFFPYYGLIYIWGTEHDLI